MPIKTDEHPDFWACKCELIHEKSHQRCRKCSSRQTQSKRASLNSVRENHSHIVNLIMEFIRHKQRIIDSEKRIRKIKHKLNDYNRRWILADDNYVKVEGKIFRINFEGIGKNKNIIQQIDTIRVIGFQEETQVKFDTPPENGKILVQRTQ